MSRPVGAAWWRVYDPQGQYVAVLKHAEDAAALVALHGDSATIRLGAKTILWTEGAEAHPAGESFDRVASTVHERADRAAELPERGRKGVGCDS